MYLCYLLKQIFVLQTMTLKIAKYLLCVDRTESGKVISTHDSVKPLWNLTATWILLTEFTAESQHVNNIFSCRSTDFITWEAARNLEAESHKAIWHLYSLRQTWRGPGFEWMILAVGCPPKQIIIDKSILWGWLISNFVSRRSYASEI